MGIFGKRNAKSLGVNILKKTPAILGCLLFLFSFIYPLYYAEFVTLAGGGSAYYWSYKVDYEMEITVVLHSNQYWFFDYWFSSYAFVGVGMPWILVSMFALQVLTLVFGVASAIFERRILSFAPVLLSLAVMALMIYTEQILYEHGFYAEYQQGYYLIYPSVILFLSAFALDEALKKKRVSIEKESCANQPSPGGEWKDVYRYCILREEWEEPKILTRAVQHQ
jgi:hypothetical protein